MRSVSSRVGTAISSPVGSLTRVVSSGRLRINCRTPASQKQRDRGRTRRGGANRWEPRTLRQTRLETFTRGQVTGYLWVSAYSCGQTGQGFIDLAPVIDCYSKKVVGWSIADHMRTELVEDALKNAAATTVRPRRRCRCRQKYSNRRRTFSLKPLRPPG